MRRSNLILLKFLLKKESKKMRSSRLLNTKPQDDGCGVRGDPYGFKKRSLRMTSSVLDEILTPLDTEGERGRKTRREESSG